MSRTNLDLLFQVTPPVGERSGFSMPRSDEPSPGFGDHLNQASSLPSDYAGTEGRAGDRPSSNDSSSNDYDSSFTEGPRNANALAAEAADREPEQDDSDESPAIEETADTQGTISNGTNVAVTSEADDGEHDTDEVDAHNDQAIVAIAEIRHKSEAVNAASAELRESTVSDDAAAKAHSPGAEVKANPSHGGDAAKRTPAESAITDALVHKPTSTTIDVVDAPTAPHKPVEETDARNATTKRLPAKPKVTAEAKSQPRHGEQSATQSVRPEQVNDVVASSEAAPAEIETATVDQTLNESTRPDRDASPDENRDADAGSSVRPRSDAAALANKIPIAAVANGVATQLEIGASSRDANDGATQVEKSAATNVDVIGDGANRFHATASSSKRGSRPSGSGETPQVDPARFVGRVAKAFHTAQERGGTLQIRLSPPELGAMRLELTVKDGVMTAALETETASARRVLLEHLPTLRDRLAEQNIRVERFDVDVRREGTGSQSDPRATQDQQQPHHDHSEQRRRQAAQPPVAGTARQAQSIMPARTNNNEINLVA